MTDQMPPGWENQVPPGPYGQPGYPPFGQAGQVDWSAPDLRPACVAWTTWPARTGLDRRPIRSPATGNPVTANPVTANLATDRPTTGNRGTGNSGGWHAAPPGGVPLRPLALGDILNGAVTLARRNPAATFGLAAIVMTIYGVIYAVAEGLYWTCGCGDR